MKKIACRCLAGLLLVSAATSGAENPIAGQWTGSVSLPGGSVSLRLEVATTDDGVSAILDIPESKLVRFPVPEATYDDRRLTFDVPREWDLAMFRDIGIAPAEQVIHYEGVRKGEAIAGKLRLASATFELELKRPRPATTPYEPELVTFRNGEVALAGTLYLPRANAPVPVVEFVHGSGNATRDAFTVEADALARAGIAALIYDKRGAGGSTGANWQVATFDELASDAAAGVAMLATRPEIDARRIGLYGHSQGTWLIGMVAEQSTDVGFLIFASGSGVAVWEQEIYRATTFMRLAGFSAADIAECERYERLKFDVARTGLGWDELAALGKSLEGAPWFDDYAGAFATLGSARFWWLAAYHIDPTPTLEHIRVPVLGLFGENDLSFPVPTVVSRMESAFAKAGNTDVTLHVIPGAEHQLMVPQMRDGRVFRRVVSPDVLPTMIQWILGHERRPADAST